MNWNLISFEELKVLFGGENGKSWNDYSHEWVPTGRRLGCVPVNATQFSKMALEKKTIKNLIWNRRRAEHEFWLAKRGKKWTEKKIERE